MKGHGLAMRDSTCFGSAERKNVIGDITVESGSSVVINQICDAFEVANSFDPIIPETLPPGFELIDREEQKKQFDSYVDNGCKIIFIQGMPGIGKTSCLNRWANQIKDRFSDGQIYFDVERFSSDNVVLTAELQKAALSAFCVKQTNQMSDIDADSLYRTRTSNRKILVVLDNVRDRSVIKAMQPNSDNALLMVAGQSEISRNDEKEQSIELDQFSDDVAREYLFEKIKLISNEEEFVLIKERLLDDESSLSEAIDRCGGMPLALEQVASLLAGGLCEIKDVASIVKDTPSEMLVALLDELIFSFNDQEKNLYHLLGMLDGCPVSLSSLKYAVSSKSGDLVNVVSAIGQLQNHRLVSVKTTENASTFLESIPKSVSMHHQIAIHAQNVNREASTSYRAMLGRFIMFHRLLAQLLDYKVTPSRLRLYKRIEIPDDFSLCSSQVTEAQRFFIEHHEEFESVVSLALDQGFNEEAQAISEALWTFYYENRMYERGLRIFSDGLSAAQLLASDKDRKLRMLALVSRCNLLLGDINRAKQTIEEALHEVNASQNYILRGSINEFAGSTERECGEYKQANEYYLAAIEEYMHYSNNRYSRGCIIADYLRVLTYLECGNNAEAEKVASDLIEHLPDDLDKATTAKVHIAKARASVQMGDLTTAEYELKEAIRLGEKYDLTSRRAEAQERLANLYCTRSNFQAARPLFEDAVRAYVSLGLITKAECIKAQVQTTYL